MITPGSDTALLGGGKSAGADHEAHQHGNPLSVEEAFAADETAVFDDELEDHSTDVAKFSSPISWALGAICLPFTLAFGCFTLQEKQEFVMLNYGKYVGTVVDPGCHWTNCWGREMRMVPTSKASIDLHNTKVVDSNGNPLMVSGIVVYQVVNTKRAAIDMDDYKLYIRNQASAVMRQVVSKFPYEHLHDHERGPTLRGESGAIGEKLVQVLQRKIVIAGAKVLSFQFNEISYAPEIAQGMLKRQQAMAMVAARNTIVHGAVEIAAGAMDLLADRGVKMEKQLKSRTAANLLTIIAGEGSVQPVMDVKTL